MAQKHAGMTLIELIVVLIVVAILSSIGLPAMAKFLTENRVTAKTNLTVAHLQFARQAAVTHRANVVACPSEDYIGCSGRNRWDNGWIIFIDRDNDRKADSPGEVLRVVAPKQDLLLHSGGRHRVRFLPSGAAYGTNLTIRVCHDRLQADARAIVVSNPGRVRVRRGLKRSECPV